MKYLSLLFFTYFFALPLFAQQNSREGKDIAVFFTEEYKGPWTKLPHISEEVAEIKTILQEKYHFSVEECKNKDRAGIEQKIRELQKRAYETDAQLLLFFSGHGVYYEAQNEGFFIPYNAPAPAEPNSESNYLSYLFLRPLINTIPCNHILVMIDACHGGSFVDEVAFKEEPEWEVDKNAKGEWINEQLKDKTRFFASAANKKERAPSKSDFASKFIDALKHPQEGIVSIHVLQSHLEKAKPAPYFSGFGYHNGGNFLFMTTESLTPLPPPPPPASVDTDKDGVPDKYDDCPTEIGAECASGCPDKDGDCITEKFGKDDCPDEKGERAFDGCPDTDKDGVPDYKDKCKNVYAATESGCPISDPDRDGDGIADSKDECPDDRTNKCKDLPDNLIFVQGGTFSMGSEDSDASSDEKPVHSVTLDDFYMSKYEVTNEEYCAFLNAKGNQSEGGVEWIDLSGSWEGEKCRISKSGSRFTVESGYNRYPVIYVSWYGARAYCEWLKETLGKPYSLPTEAQWEYAARSKGLANKYAWGNASSPTNGANVADETAKAKHGWSSIFENYTDGYVYTCPVEKSGINAIGLYGMSGNVWEWCSDYYGDYPTNASKNPTGATSGSDRVLRGGSWYSHSQDVRCAHSDFYSPGNRTGRIGFRFVLSSR